MQYKYEDKLRQKAEEFISALKGDAIRAYLVEESFREYSVKIFVSDDGHEFGHVNIYYSPKADNFTLVTSELKDKSIVPVLEAYWRGMSLQTASHTKGVEIYVDGSYINGSIGYGVVVLKDGQVVEELKGAVTDRSVAHARQVGGELFAVEEAIRWCQRNSVKEVSIYYDYYGVERWATGRWKTNQALTANYREFVRNSGVKIRWHKVASHTGNRWNERADYLAKQGALSQLAPASDDDRISELLEALDRFIEFLMVRGVEAELDKIYNDQFARLFIIEDYKPIGTFDLYHTRKKPLSPYLHNFKDDEMKSKLAALWSEFLLTSQR
ncbi:MAG TPA: RNase H family protein [Blastocatellia bacterium]|nr:RNase H family protein [Blastocatellia bacterium]